MTTILVTAIGTAALLINSAERLLADMTQLVCAAKSLCASLRRSKQDTRAPGPAAEKGEIRTAGSRPQSQTH